VRLGLRDHLLVALRGAQLEEDGRVFDVARQLLDDADLLLEARSAPRDGLRLLLIVPEARSQRLLLELVDRGLQPRKVKDAPLAP
jgi:hypothetical protein